MTPTSMKRLSLFLLLGGFAMKGLVPAEAVIFAASPTLTASNVSLIEGNSGTRVATIIVTLSVAPTNPLKILYSTADGSAEAGSDYVLTQNSVTVAANTKTFSIEVPINGDVQVERDEIFKVNFSTLGYKSHRPGALVTIINDDKVPPTSSNRNEPRMAFSFRPIMSRTQLPIVQHRTKNSKTHQTAVRYFAYAAQC
ncbi:hypothetical protein EON83_12920 [bacterium]|nr:MAG: hypothetical protein EON83_12920 [bacterium]